MCNCAREDDKGTKKKEKKKEEKKAPPYDPFSSPVTSEDHRGFLDFVPYPFGRSRNSSDAADATTEGESSAAKATDTTYISPPPDTTFDPFASEVQPEDRRWLGFKWFPFGASTSTIAHVRVSDEFDPSNPVVPSSTRNTPDHADVQWDRATMHGGYTYRKKKKSTIASGGPTYIPGFSDTTATGTASVSGRTSAKVDTGTAGVSTHTGNDWSPIFPYIAGSLFVICLVQLIYRNRHTISTSNFSEILSGIKNYIKAFGNIRNFSLGSFSSFTNLGSLKVISLRPFKSVTYIGESIGRVGSWSWSWIGSGTGSSSTRTWGRGQSETTGTTGGSTGDSVRSSWGLGGSKSKSEKINEDSGTSSDSKSLSWGRSDASGTTSTGGSTASDEKITSGGLGIPNATNSGTTTTGGSSISSDTKTSRTESSDTEGTGHSSSAGKTSASVLGPFGTTTAGPNGKSNKIDETKTGESKEDSRKTSGIIDRESAKPSATKVSGTINTEYKDKSGETKTRDSAGIDSKREATSENKGRPDPKQKIEKTSKDLQAKSADSVAFTLSARRTDKAGGSEGTRGIQGTQSSQRIGQTAPTDKKDDSGLKNVSAKLSDTSRTGVTPKSGKAMQNVAKMPKDTHLNARSDRNGQAGEIIDKTGQPREAGRSNATKRLDLKKNERKIGDLSATQAERVKIETKRGVQRTDVTEMADGKTDQPRQGGRSDATKRVDLTNNELKISATPRTERVKIETKRGAQRTDVTEMADGKTDQPGQAGRSDATKRVDLTKNELKISDTPRTERVKIETKKRTETADSKTGQPKQTGRSNATKRVDLTRNELKIGEDINVNARLDRTGQAGEIIDEAYGKTSHPREAGRSDTTKRVDLTKNERKIGNLSATPRAERVNVETKRGFQRIDITQMADGKTRLRNNANIQDTDVSAIGPEKKRTSKKLSDPEWTGTSIKQGGTERKMEPRRLVSKDSTGSPSKSEWKDKSETPSKIDDYKEFLGKVNGAERKDANGQKSRVISESITGKPGGGKLIDIPDTAKRKDRFGKSDASEWKDAPRKSSEVEWEKRTSGSRSTEWKNRTSESGKKEWKDITRVPGITRKDAIEPTGISGMKETSGIPRITDWNQMSRIEEKRELTLIENKTIINKGGISEIKELSGSTEVTRMVKSEGGNLNWSIGSIWDFSKGLHQELSNSEDTRVSVQFVRGTAGSSSDVIKKVKSRLDKEYNKDTYIIEPCILDCKRKWSKAEIDRTQ